MGIKAKTAALTEALLTLRTNDDFDDARIKISDALNLKDILTVFELKVFLIEVTKDGRNRIKKSESDIVLMAFGLLDGYYCDESYIEGTALLKALEIGARREKYLSSGPYIRTKRGRRYSSYDDLEDQAIKKSIKNAFSRKDERLIMRLAKYIAGIKNPLNYIRNAVQNSEYVIKNMPTQAKAEKLIRLPKQCYFLQDFPAPEESIRKSDAGENAEEPFARNEDEDHLQKVIFDDNMDTDAIPPVEEIFTTEREIILTPGKKHELKVVVLPKEAVNTPLSYVSLDPDIVTVSTSGMLLAHNLPQKSEPKNLWAFIKHRNDKPSSFRTVIIIQAESGASTRKEVTVDFSHNAVTDLPIENIDEFAADFSIEQEVRLAGDTEWTDTLEAVNIGDKVEFLITYKNIGTEVQRDVILQDTLPKNIRYVPNTTLIYNRKYNGGLMTDDNITTTGVNIGNYGPNITAYVQFTAEVVDNSLQEGANVLANWAQCTVGQVALQDYVILGLNKE